MVQIGNFFFRNRNGLFPFFYVCLFVPSREIFTDYRVAIVLGLLVSCMGQAARVATIGLRYIIRGGKDRQIYAEDLVTDGIFTHCRNPLYVGNILVLLGLGIASNSIFFMAVMMPVFLFIYQALVLAEENFLSNKFGQAFNAYTQKTHRWLPNMKGITATLQQMHFNWKRVLIKEYNSTYIWMTGFVLVLAKHIYVHDGRESFRERMPLLVAALLLLLALYLFARYLKKSKRVTE